jgi:hypothetical protein
MKRVLAMAAIAASASAFGSLVDTIIENADACKEAADAITVSVASVEESLQSVEDSLAASSLVGEYDPKTVYSDWETTCNEATAGFTDRYNSAQNAVDSAVASLKAATDRVSKATDGMVKKYAKSLAQKLEEVKQAADERKGVSYNTIDYATKDWCVEHLVVGGGVGDYSVITIHCDCVDEIRKYEYDGGGDIEFADGNVAGNWEGFKAMYDQYEDINDRNGWNMIPIPKIVGWEELPL